MRKTRTKSILGCSLIVILVVLWGCGSDGPNEPTVGASVTGTLSLPAQASGSTYYILIDQDPDGDNGYIKLISGVCGPGTTINYSFNDVPVGTYYVYAAVFVVGDSEGDPQPGDFLGFYGTGMVPAGGPNAVVPSSGTVTFNITLDQIPSVSTRLYVRTSTLSTTPYTDLGRTQVFVYGSSDWSVTLSGDMVGTKCTFGILFAVPPATSMNAKAEIILKKGQNETVLAGKSFTVASSTYTRFLETVDISDPVTSNGDELILRITRTSNGSQGLGVMVETAAPNDSYIEVPGVDI